MMGPPTNMDEEPNRIVDVIEQESDDGSDDPKTVALENEENKFFEKTQTYPPVGEKQISNDVSLEEETKAVDTEGVYRHRDLHGGKKPLRENNLSDEDRANSLESVEILEGAKLLRSEKVTKARFEVQETSGKQKEPKGQNKERNIGMQHSGLDGVRCPDANHKPGNGDSPKKNSPSGHLKKKEPPENRNSPRNWKIFGPLKLLFAVDQCHGWNWLTRAFFLQVTFGPALVIAQDLCYVPEEYEPGCSFSGSRRDDDILDAWDVQAGLSNRDFNGSGRNISKVCSNSFHDLEIENVMLQKNFLASFPCGIFNYTEGLERVNLSENEFYVFPLAGSLSSIKNLNLANNHLSQIERGAMDWMISLTSLNLSGNKNMDRVSQDVFYLIKNYLLKIIFLEDTKVEHPLLPPPHDELCTPDSPCNVTHRADGVKVEVAGKMATFVFSPFGNLTCQELKDQLEAHYEVVTGSISCKNEVLDGSVTIYRKSENGAEIADGTSPTDKATSYVPPTETSITYSTVWVLIVAGFVAGIIILIIVYKCFFAEGTLCFNKISTQVNHLHRQQVPCTVQESEC